MENNLSYAEAAVETLNEFLQLDAEAMNHMMQLSVAVNEKIVEHPTIICYCEEYPIAVCRFLGLLNGIAHKIDKGQTITAVYGQDGCLQKFMLYDEKEWVD